MCECNTAKLQVPLPWEGLALFCLLAIDAVIGYLTLDCSRIGLYNSCYYSYGMHYNHCTYISLVDQGL